MRSATCHSIVDHPRTVGVAPTQDVARMDLEHPESEETMEWGSGLGNLIYYRNPDSSSEAAIDIAIGSWT